LRSIGINSPGSSHASAVADQHDPARFQEQEVGWISNVVEGLFAALTRQRLKRGVFTSIVDLQAAINRFMAETNDKPKPFVWTKSADAVAVATAPL
jgi:hypothetical protein